ncbi:hypothetical protein FNU76_13550 [Chitinimonas arctica]|uniref:Uncharacterized protein n=1 Tax=Chitinimonas arctica TaxID=2594795 RepID=A0A516SGL7_9NEIS|nr:hypothetical protein [Chitinimonas arctica]QDQ27307.1 hypothetical protein FNU76_13550 [Chitinimonas arctica]
MQYIHFSRYGWYAAKRSVSIYSSNNRKLYSNEQSLVEVRVQKVELEGSFSFWYQQMNSNKSFVLAQNQATLIDYDRSGRLTDMKLMTYAEHRLTGLFTGAALGGVQSLRSYWRDGLPDQDVRADYREYLFHHDYHADG